MKEVNFLLLLNAVMKGSLPDIIDHKTRCKLVEMNIHYLCSELLLNMFVVFLAIFCRIGTIYEGACFMCSYD